LKLKCTEFDFDWGSAPKPAERAYIAAPDPLAVGLLLKEEYKKRWERMGRSGREKGKGREGKREKRKRGRERKGKWGLCFMSLRG